MVHRIRTSKTKVLRIRCSEDVWRAFRRYAADYTNYEEALIELLRCANAFPSRGVIY